MELMNYAFYKAMDKKDGSSDITVEPLTVIKNGVTTAPEGTAYNPVTTNVPNTYTASDAGKVVRLQGGGGSGSRYGLSTQTAVTKTGVGTYATPYNNSVTFQLAALTNAAAAEDIASGKTAYGADGAVITGTASGGGNTSNVLADVTLIDYEGTVLHTYTADEFLALEALPANPDRTGDGLTAQGWNWTLADAKAYVTNHGYLVIGQMYEPTDGKTKLIIDVFDTTIPIYFCWNQSAANSVVVDFGDGTSSDPKTGTGNKNVNHTYEATGTYTITFTVSSGSMCLGGTAVGYSSMRRDGEAAWLKRIVLGNGTTLGASSNAFSNKARLESIVIPPSITSRGVTGLSANAIVGCESLRGIVLPSGFTSMTTSSISGCANFQYVALPGTLSSMLGSGPLALNGLRIVTFPDAITALSGDTCNRCTGLEIVTLPNAITAVPAAFGFCYNLQEIVIPEGVTSIANYAFQSCAALRRIVIPSTVTSIGTGAFSELRNVRTITIKATTPPTLANSNAFASYPSDCKFIVPAGTLETYQAATNWSTYAAKMEEATI